MASSSDDGRICTLRGISGQNASGSGHSASEVTVKMVTPHGQTYVRGLAWSAAGNTLYSGGWDGTITGSPCGLELDVV